MKRHLMAICALGALLALGADAPQEQALRDDLEKLQGSWTVESMEMDGKLMSDAARKKIKLAVQGENFRFHNGNSSHGGLYKLDPTKDPKELNIVITEGGEK